MTPPVFAPGDPVVITAGLLRGARGRVHAAAGYDFAAGEPHYRVDVVGCELLRDIRASFLRRAA